MNKGEWLLRHYNAFKSRTEILMIRLNQLQTDDAKEQIKNEWILGSSLSAPLSEEHIKSHGLHSRTEMLAINCETTVKSL